MDSIIRVLGKGREAWLESLEMEKHPWTVMGWDFSREKQVDLQNVKFQRISERQDGSWSWIWEGGRILNPESPGDLTGDL